jgi:predicted DCC family thiol-disulfide oxidoreductase YuxK
VALLCGVNDAVLLYDGRCGFCDGVVQFVLARDANGTLRFAPLQGDFARGVLERHPALRGVDSLILVTSRATGETVAVRSDAALGVADYLGGPWNAARILRLVPGPVRDWGYDLFARHRHRLFGRRNTCRVPDPDARARFLA